MSKKINVNDYAEYQYTGRSKLLFDDHHDEFMLEFHPKDRYHLKFCGKYYSIVNEHDPAVELRAKSTDSILTKLMSKSVQIGFEFIPNPRSPAYPDVSGVNKKNIKELYEYFNNKYFNGKCPKFIQFETMTSKNVQGQAQTKPNLEDRSRTIYKLLLNYRMIGEDQIEFVDTMLHEMIHLYLMHKGVMEDNVDYYNASHGPLFVKEMQRINAHGFGINILVDYEKQAHRDDVSHMELYFMMAYDHNNLKRGNKIMWYFKPKTESELIDIAKQLYPIYKSSFTVEQFATTDIRIKRYVQAPKTRKLTKEIRTKNFNKPVLSSCRNDIIYVYDPERFIDVESDKDMFEAACNTMSVFKAYMRNQGITDIKVAEDIWMMVKFNKAKPVIEKAILDLCDEHEDLGIGLNTLNLRVSDMAKRGAYRFGREYRKLVEDLAQKHINNSDYKEVLELLCEKL